MQSLLLQVALIIGVFGACRRAELKDMTLDQMVFCDKPNGVLINLPKTKNDVIRQFVVGEGDRENVNLISVVRKYAKLRPANMDNQRFFLTYRKGVCVRQPIGIHSIGGYPKIIATFLKLPNTSTFTGHCYRRSGVSMMAESGATLADMRRHCGWVNQAMAERYIELSVNNKRKIAGHILGMKPTSIAELVQPTNNEEDLVAEPTISSSTEMPNSMESASGGPTISSITEMPNSMESASGGVIAVRNTSNEPLGVNSIRTVTVVQSQKETVESHVTASHEKKTNHGLEINVLSNCTINIYRGLGPQGQE